MTHDLRHDDGSHTYRHCPMCGHRLESRVVMRHDPPRLVCGGCGFVFYRGKTNQIFVRYPLPIARQYL